MYDIIFMDIGLPDINGMEVTAKVRAFELKNGRKSVIIGLTAYELKDVTAPCLSAGMDQVLQKPMSLDMLKQLVAISS